MEITSLQQLGIADGLITHLRDYHPSTLLGYRVQPALYWQSSPISKRNIVALWECETTLTYYDIESSTFRQCYLEDIESDICRHHSIQPILSKLFIELYEDELSEEQILSVAKQVDFAHAERLLLEIKQQNRDTYQAWIETFALSCGQEK